jgi:hypothetical protein
MMMMMMKCYQVSKSWAGIAYRRHGDSLRVGRSGDRIPSEARFSAPVQNGPNGQENAVLPCIADTNRQPFRIVLILINLPHNIINTFPATLISILSSHLHPCLPCGLFPLGFPDKKLHPILISPARSICPAHPDTLTILSERYQ